MSAVRRVLARLFVASLSSCGSDAVAADRPMRSDAVKVDQVGYLPQRTMVALVTDARAAGAFSVRRVRDDTEVLTGSLGPPRLDPDTGDTVRAADFSRLGETGAFYLDVAGVGTSDPFDVSGDVYVSAFRLAARSFYGQRCGTAVDLAPSHPGYSHPACHVAGTRNPDALFHPSSGTSGTLDGTGGWHDAGDYGKYVVNSNISTAQLLWTAELFPGRVAALTLGIPESGNTTPDLLDEARWNLAWMLTMQDADGGVWHKLTSERFGSFTLPHLDDGGPRYVIGTGASPHKSSCATAGFAAVMAIAARVFRPFDASFAATTQAAAERAWRWLDRFPNVTFANCCGVQTGEYGDRDCSDERLWAAAELLGTTGGADYHAYFLANHAPAVTALETGTPSAWPDLRHMALATYAIGDGPGADPSLRGRLRAALVAGAQVIVARTAANPYRVSLKPTDYVWGSNGVVANYGVVLALASLVQPDAAFLDTAAENLHYLLGRNTFGLSWMTQVGDRPFRNPHHRPSGADTNAEPWPGLLSGGPNRYGGDPVIDAMPATPPARRYRDDQASYASNENAINWNAPLVFLLAALAPDPAR